MTVLREWGDALVIAFVLAMFIRVFVVELFKIPTGSMSPTLLGDEIAEVDWNNDGLTDIVVNGQQRLVFLNKGDRYEVDPDAQPTDRDVRQWRREGLIKPQHDRILVNKFAYWWKHPDRGDVIVFKIPPAIWDPAKPIYIKRVVGLPGETISFDGRLMVDGKLVDQPPFFQHQRYINEIRDFYPQLDYFEYDAGDYPIIEIEKIHVPHNGLIVFGDNTHSSLDSRYWGKVPLQNVKGKAFMRYWPFDKIKFIR